MMLSPFAKPCPNSSALQDGTESSTRSGRFAWRALGIAAAAMVMQGCTMVYKTTGDILVNFGRGEMTPYVLTYDDLGMACATGEGFTPFLTSFETVGSKPNRLSVLMNTMAATCSDAMAIEEELRYLRAMNRGDVTEAQDARAAQKRWAQLSAKRQYEAYQRTVKQYGEVETLDDCPRLRQDFDEIVFMTGLLSGVQSLLNDAASDVSQGIPRDIAAKVERAAQCLDNEKWWGVPRGIRASLWNILPMIAPDNVDAMAELRQAAQRGFDAGVRLSSTLYVISAYSTGNDDEVRNGLRGFAQHGDNLNPDYAMMDAIGGFMLLGISDRLWTEATGKRTPFGGLGTFWDDSSSGDSINIDDLL